jgi:hypothetical protein
MEAKVRKIENEKKELDKQARDPGPGWHIAFLQSDVPS